MDTNEYDNLNFFYTDELQKKYKYNHSYKKSVDGFDVIIILHDFDGHHIVGTDLNDD